MHALSPSTDLPFPSVGKPCDPATGNEHYTETIRWRRSVPATFLSHLQQYDFREWRMGSLVSNFGDPTGTTRCRSMFKRRPTSQSAAS